MASRSATGANHGIVSTASLVVGVAAAGATLPNTFVRLVSAVSLVCLVSPGAPAARIGGVPMFVGAADVTILGVLAMLATAGVGRLFGAAVD